jgi:hypothetical protein
MSRYCPHAEDFCGFSTANTRARELATSAIDGDEAAVRRADLEEVAEALDTLESCRRHDCSFHSDERHARAFLQALVDADDAVEIEEARHAAE